MKMRSMTLIKTCFLLLAVQGICTSLSAQADAGWKGKKCAVVLTYDDGLNIDLSHVVPALDSAGFKGTFYISDNANKLHTQIEGWRKAAAEGHELANHTVFHPCDATRPGMDWVKPEYDLSRYTLRRVNDEMLSMNTTLQAIDGKSERTFAYPCGDTKIRDSAYIDPLRKDFVAARGTSPLMLTADKVDLYNVGCFSMNNQRGADMIALVRKALQTHTLLVFLFHGVGGEHNLNVSLEDHSQLIHFLRENQKDIWVAPMMDVAKWIRNTQSQPK